MRPSRQTDIKKKSIFDIDDEDETPILRPSLNSVKKKTENISKISLDLAEDVAERITENQSNIEKNIKNVKQQFPDSDPNIIESVVTNDIVNDIINTSINNFVSEGRISTTQADELLLDLEDEMGTFQPNISQPTLPSIPLKNIPPERLKRVEDLLREIQKPKEKMSNLVSIQQKVFRSLGLIN